MQIGTVISVSASFSVSVAAAPAQELFNPVDFPIYAPGLVSEAEASFQGMSASPENLLGWNLQADLIPTDGAIQTDGALASNREFKRAYPIPAGEVWVGFDQAPVADLAAGSARALLDAPDQNGDRNHRRTGMTVQAFTNVSSQNFGARFNNGYNGSIRHTQLYDPASVLAMPRKFVITFGQSPMACQTSSEGVDVLAGDGWRDMRALTWTTADNGAFDQVQHTLEASVIPLQTQSQNSYGVSPIHSFQTGLLSVYPDHAIVVIHCAVGGTKLLGDTAPWNPDGDRSQGGGVLYDGLISNVQAALAASPAGSEIEVVVGGHGQSDDGANVRTTYPPAKINLINRLRSDLGVPDLPFVMLGPDPTNSDWDNLALALQDVAAAMTNVYYQAAPDNHSEDGTHLTNVGSRLAGLMLFLTYVSQHLQLAIDHILTDGNGYPITTAENNFITVE
jgi:hypothetical protein